MTTKPDLTRTWANSAPGGNIIDPDVGEPGKWDAGWISEIPPFEYFNYLHQIITQGLAHFNEHGVGVWDTDTEYPLKGWSKGSDGILYVSLQAANIGQDPVADATNTWWEPLLTTYSDMKTDRKNLVINGSFVVHQRDSWVAIPSTTGYLAPDRFIIEGSAVVGGSGSYSKEVVGGGSAIPGTVFFARQTWVGATGVSKYIHNVEGVFFAENRDMTLTFLVRSTITTTITSSIQVIFDLVDSLPPETQTINLVANVWQKVTQKVSYGDFIGVNLASGDGKIQIIINHDAPGSYNFDLSQVQFEFGDVPTEFEYRSTSEEEFLCSRFFLRLEDVLLYPPGSVDKYNATNLNLATTMRRAPTETITYLDENGVVTDNRSVSTSRRKASFVSRFTNLGTANGRQRMSVVFLDAEIPQ